MQILLKILIEHITQRSVIVYILLSLSAFVRRSDAVAVQAYSQQCAPTSRHIFPSLNNIIYILINMTTFFISDERMLKHKCEWDNSHIERPDRLKWILEKLRVSFYAIKLIK